VTLSPGLLLVLAETGLERRYGGAEERLTTWDDYCQRQQEQSKEPQRKLREHRSINDDC